MIDNEELQFRKDALAEAQKIVDPVVAKFPPEEYRVTHSPAVVFSVPAGSTVTPVETVLRLYMDIGEWLLKEHKD